jgi:hypothetical protein
MTTPHEQYMADCARREQSVRQAVLRDSQMLEGWGPGITKYYRENPTEEYVTVPPALIITDWSGANWTPGHKYIDKFNGRWSDWFLERSAESMADGGVRAENRETPGQNPDLDGDRSEDLD